MDQNDLKICSICHREFTEWGNNADPINFGRCCDSCNQVVIIARMNRQRAVMKHGYEAVTKAEDKELA